MTLIAGYILSNTVQIICDSAVTIHNPQKNTSRSVSSFGDVVQNDENKEINENSNKLYTIKNSIICTFSGIATEGKNILEDIQILIKTNQKTSISKLLELFFKENQPQNTEYIFGFIEDEKPTLFYFEESKVFKKQNNDAIVVLGAGGQNPDLITRLVLSNYKLLNENRNPDISLITNISVLQSSSILFRTFTYGIGGFFNGAFISKKGIKWSEDSMFILYSSKNFLKSEKFSVRICNRDNAVCVLSSKNGRNVYIPKLIWMNISIEEWKKSWFSDDYRSLKFDAKYYCFVCYDRLIVTIISKDNPEFKKYITNINYIKNEADLNITRKLISSMTTYMVNKETGKEADINMMINLH